MHADTTMTWTLLSLLSFVISWVGIRAILRRFAGHFMDLPNPRSSHAQPTPRGGGIAFVSAFFITAGLAALVITAEPGGPRSSFPKMVAVLLPLLLIGSLDDSRGISAGVRYLVQLVAAGLAVFWFGALPAISAILGGVGDPWLGSLATVLAISAIINFYNFMDGLDGIVGGTSAVQFAFFAWYLHQPTWWLLVAALLAFLLWNWPPAKIFMGDSGSTVLGGAVGLALLQAPDAKTMWCAGAVTAPLVGDALFTLLRRAVNRENVFEAHKSHIYQRLHQAGWSHQRVSTIYVVVTLLIAVLVVALT